MRRMFASAAAAALAAIATPAAAGEDFRLRFPQILTLSPHGVNLQTGRFEWSQKEFSIGPMTLDWRGTSPGVGTSTAFPTANGADNWGGAANMIGMNLRGWFYHTTINTFGGSNYLIAEVKIGDQNPRFYINAGTPKYTPWNNEAYAWTLVESGTSVIARYKNGDTYTLAAISAFSNPRKILTKAEYADGHQLDYSYGSKGELKQILSNRGYAIVLEYNSNARTITACGYNRAVTYITSNTTCAAAPVKTVYTGTPAGQLFGFLGMTNADGATSSLSYTNGLISCMTFYGSPTCRLQLSYGNQPGDPSPNTAPDQVRKLTTANGNLWTFFYKQPPDPTDAPPPDPGAIRYTEGNMYDPQGNLTNAVYGNGIVQTITSPAGILNYEFNGLCPQKVTYPEGNATVVGIKLDCSVTSIGMNPKPGSPQSAQTDVAYTYIEPEPPTYTPCDYTTKVCDKPMNKTDGRGNVTDYRWDSQSGLLLSELAPAVNGVRALKWFTYQPRYALVKNSSGGFIQAATPVWVLTQESLCKSGGSNMTVWPAAPPPAPACDVASDEVKTTYDYGPTSGAANNLLVRNVVVDSGTGKLNLRTCYVYDAQGNKIAETKPRGATGGCP